MVSRGPKRHPFSGPKKWGQKTDPIFDEKRGHPQWVPTLFASFWGHFWYLDSGPCFQAVNRPDLDARRDSETISRRAHETASMHMSVKAT